MFIVHCSPNDCFSFRKIRQNIPVYVNRKKAIQKFWSILNLLHLLTSYLFSKKNSAVAGDFKIMYLPPISKEPRGMLQNPVKHLRFANTANNHSLFFARRSILDTWQGSEFASETYFIIRYGSCRIWKKILEKDKGFTRVNWTISEVFYVFLK